MWLPLLTPTPFCTALGWAPEKPGLVHADARETDDDKGDVPSIATPTILRKSHSGLGMRKSSLSFNAAEGSSIPWRPPGAS